MNKTIKLIATCTLVFILSLTNVHAQKIVSESFEKFRKLEIIGRGICEIGNGVLVTNNAYASFGGNTLENFEARFKARVPATAKEVQIWFGFRANNRNDRYIVGLKGGLSNDLFLGRLGYMGTDEFLGLRALDFAPIPGQWYNFRTVVCGNRIQVYINDEILPRIDITDTNSNLAPSGNFTLGGGYIDNEFDDLIINEIPDNFLENQPKKEYSAIVTVTQKETQRIKERSEYRPVIINHISENTRTEISLDGKWLFKPDYELNNKEKAISTITNDENWHIMTVPNFWNPIRIWLHGETFNNASGTHAKGISDTYFQKETARCDNYTFDFRKTKAAWYRQWLELPTTIKDKNLTLTFDAVSKVAEVYINGQLAASNIGMFSEIKVDGTKYFKPGRNLIAVHVIRDYVQDIEDADKVVDVAVTVPVTNKMLKDIAHGFYCEDPAGIWQSVKLEISDPVRIEDVFIKPTLTGATFDISIKNYTDKRHVYMLSTSIHDKQNGNVLFSDNASLKIVILPNEEKLFSFQVDNLQPKLWTPQHPNLYDFSFALTKKNEKKSTDNIVITSGFRTFEAKNGYLYLNGKRYWLRGGNHTPFALAPNNKQLANTFFQLMKAGNIEVTRTHTTPFNKLWMDAADRNGIGISHEGTWPWLMILSSMPEKRMIELWADEYLSLLKKYRNHPSLLFWTINNEMKFYDNEPDLEKAKQKMHIISDVVKRMRETDPTRPVCFDSNYKRRTDKFGDEFFETIDDGDIDDIHAYINWYHNSVFQQFNGEFQRQNMNPGRPLISQEMSTGYPNSETGHPTNFYTFVHQNPQTLVGNLAFDYADPKYFLNSQCFITKELAEALRRTNDQASGILHFALISWFRNVYDAERVEPYPTYYGIKNALSPVLVSAELWGRHFYEDSILPVRVCVVNDMEDGSDLAPGNLIWELRSNNGKKITSGSLRVPVVRHYARQWVMPHIQIPANLSVDRMDGQLVFSLYNKEKLIATNEYDITFAKKEWIKTNALNNKSICLIDFDSMKESFDFAGIKYTPVKTIDESLKQKYDVIVMSGMNNENCSAEAFQKIKQYIQKGGKVLMLNCNEIAKSIYPEYIENWIIPTEGDIVNIEIPESSVFDGIELLDLRYFNNNIAEIPTVCNSVLKIYRNPNVEELTSQMKIHGYINGNMQERSAYVKTIKGSTIVRVKDSHGTVLISTMSLHKANTDPIAGKLLVNLIRDL